MSARGRISVTDIRERLGLSVAEFAGVLGVNAGTVYRWQLHDERAIRFEPPLAFQSDLCWRMHVLSRGNRAVAQAVGASLVQALRAGGTAFALYTLLALFYSRFPIDAS